jgi:hypothetical protein
MDTNLESPDEVQETSQIACRRDGWTPFARKVFLSALAESGRVNFACQCAGLSKQSAFGLRTRDPVFAAGWDAACHMARSVLANELMELAIGGVTDTIMRNGEVLVERRRHDPRLSIAVLNRLDQRCDEASRRGPRYLNAARHWDEWLAMIGDGNDKGAAAVLATGSLPNAADGQLGQLPSAGPASNLADSGGNSWTDEEEDWWTDHAPPPGFDGEEVGRWNAFGYKRRCDDEENELLIAVTAAEDSESLAEAEAQRQLWLADLREEIEELLQKGSDDQLTEALGDPLLGNARPA